MHDPKKTHYRILLETHPMGSVERTFAQRDGKILEFDNASDADYALMNKDHDRIRFSYRKVLKFNQEQYDEMKSKFTDALDSADKQIESRDFNSPKDFMVCTRAYLKMGRYEDAIYYLETLDTYFPDAYNKKKIEDQMQSIENEISQCGSKSAIYHMKRIGCGDEYSMEEEQIGLNIAFLTVAISGKTIPKLAEAYYLRGLEYQKVEMLENAKNDFHKATVLDPQFAKTQ